MTRANAVVLSVGLSVIYDAVPQRPVPRGASCRVRCAHSAGHAV